jgi:methylglutaconyl-CoA hydratase
MQGADSPILTSRDGPTARLTLNRPDSRNALDPDLAGALVAAIRVASDDPSVRVIVLTGAGSAFCAGAKLDGLLAAIEQGDAGPTGAYFGAIEEVYRALLAARPPVIAMVNGHALAGGAGVATACDLVIASENAQFGYPEVHVGLAPGMVMVLLFRLVGFRLGLELALTGRRVTAGEAAEIGLINRVVPHDQLESSVREVADQLAALSPSALALIKRTAWALPDLELPRALAHARDVSTLCALTPDARAGISGFLHKGGPRAP